MTSVLTNIGTCMDRGLDALSICFKTQIDNVDQQLWISTFSLCATDCGTLPLLTLLWISIFREMQSPANSTRKLKYLPVFGKLIDRLYQVLLHGAKGQAGPSPNMILMPTVGGMASKDELPIALRTSTHDIYYSSVCIGLQYTICKYMYNLLCWGAKDVNDSHI